MSWHRATVSCTRMSYQIALSLTKVATQLTMMPAEQNLTLTRLDLLQLDASAVSCWNEPKVHQMRKTQSQHKDSTCTDGWLEGRGARVTRVVSAVSRVISFEFLNCLRASSPWRVMLLALHVAFSAWFMDGTAEWVKRPLSTAARLQMCNLNSKLCKNKLLFLHFYNPENLEIDVANTRDSISRLTGEISGSVGFGILGLDSLHVI